MIIYNYGDDFFKHGIAGLSTVFSSTELNDTNISYKVNVPAFMRDRHLIPLFNVQHTYITLPFYHLCPRPNIAY